MNELGHAYKDFIIFSTFSGSRTAFLKFEMLTCSSYLSFKDQVSEKSEMEPIKEESESPPPSTPNPMGGNLPHSPNSAFQAATLSAPTTATATPTVAPEFSGSQCSASLETGPVVYSQQQAMHTTEQVCDDDDDKSTEV